MDLFDATVRTVLDEMRLMEARLTEKIAGERCFHPRLLDSDPDSPYDCTSTDPDALLPSDKAKSLLDTYGVGEFITTGAGYSSDSAGYSRNFPEDVVADLAADHLFGVELDTDPNTSFSGPGGRLCWGNLPSYDEVEAVVARELPGDETGAEAATQKEEPVDTPTKCSMRVLNRGAYSVPNLPVVCIVGGSNSNDYGANRALHHTIDPPDFSQELRCFQTVTSYQSFILIPLEIFHVCGMIRPMPWPSFTSSVNYCMNLDARFVWKPPWSLQRYTRASITLQELLTWLGYELIEDWAQQKCDEAWEFLTLEDGVESVPEQTEQLMRALSLSTAAWEGTDTGTAMRLSGCMLQQDPLILMESGSSHTFVSEHLRLLLSGVQELPHSITVQVASSQVILSGVQFLTKPMAVQVASNQVVSSSYHLPLAEWSMSSCSFKFLPSPSCDLVVGMDGLQQHNPIRVDWANKWMVIQYKALVELLLLSSDTSTDLVLASEVHDIDPQVQVILSQFADVFEDPVGLPPSRTCDHTIPLSDFEPVINALMVDVVHENQKSVLPGRFERHRGQFKYDDKPNFSMEVLAHGKRNLAAAWCDCELLFSIMEWHIPWDVNLLKNWRSRGLYSFDVSSVYKYKNTTVEVKLDTESNISTTLTVLDAWASTKLVTSVKIPDSNSGKVELQYFHENVITCNQFSIKRLSRIRSVLSRFSEIWDEPVTLPPSHQYGIRSKPLTELLRKHSLFVWTAEHQQDFEALKHALITAPVLALPDFSLPFGIYTDACKTSAHLLHVLHCTPTWVQQVIQGYQHLLRAERVFQVPLTILQTRLMERGGELITQVKVTGSGMDEALTTWEDAEALQTAFPRAPAWGQAVFEDGGNVSTAVQKAMEEQVDDMTMSAMGRLMRSKKMEASSRMAGALLRQDRRRQVRGPSVRGGQILGSVGWSGPCNGPSRRES